MPDRPEIFALRRGSVFLLLGLLIAVWGRFACDSQSDQAPQPERATPNILLIVVDALRADRVGVYGNENDNTPTIDQISHNGVVVESAIAAAPWTQPSMGSLFSANYPGVHKVLDYKHAIASSEFGQKKIAVFSDSFKTLAEVLRDGGYRTAGISANPLVMAEYGFAQGFDHWDVLLADTKVSGDAVNAAAKEWLQQGNAGKPFFLYLHYMDCHGPYDAPLEFLNPLLDEVEAMPDKQRLTPLEKSRLEYLRALPDEYADDLERHERLAKYREYWEARYQAGVMAADWQIGRLRAMLKTMDLWKDTYVIITADHGEALCEHQFWDHGYSLYSTDLHVPLILRWPGQLSAGTTLSGVVSQIDLMPTLLTQLGMKPPKNIQGKSILQRLTGEAEPGDHLAFAEGVKHGPKRKAVYCGHWKLSYSVPFRTYRLFDLADDPLEQENLARSIPRPPKFAELRSSLAAQLAENRRRSAAVKDRHVSIDEEQLERLKSLGYVGD